MKRYEQKIVPLIRIQFGTKSMSFTDTTVEEMFSLFLEIFSDVKIDINVNVKDWCPLHKPSNAIDLTVYIREEIGSKKMNNSKSKTLYGISAEKAMEIFEKNYENYYKIKTIQ